MFTAKAARYLTKQEYLNLFTWQQKNFVFWVKYISIYLASYLPTYLPTNLSIYLSIYLFKKLYQQKVLTVAVTVEIIHMNMMDIYYNSVTFVVSIILD